MSDLNLSDESGSTQDSFYAERQSPSKSSPELTAKRLKKTPSILPFSDPSKSEDEGVDAFDEDRPETAVEIAAPDSMKQSQTVIHTDDQDHPIIRSAHQAQELQQKYFRLQVELKEVRDELEKLVKPAKQADSTNNVNDETPPLDSVLSSEIISQLRSENEKLERKIQNLIEEHACVTTTKSNNEDLLESNTSQKQYIDELIDSLNSMKKSLNDSNALVVAYKGDAEFWKRKATDLQTENESNREEIGRLNKETHKLEADLIDAQRAHDMLLNQAAKPSFVESEQHNSIDADFHPELPSGMRGNYLDELHAKLKYVTKEKTQISKMLEEQLQVNDRNRKMLNEAEVYIKNLRRDLHNGNRENRQLRQEFNSLQTSYTDSETLKNNLEKELTDTKVLVDSLKHQKVLLEESVESKDEENKKAREFTKQLESRISNLLDEENIKNEKIRNFERIQKQLRERISSQKISIAELKSQFSDLEKQKQTLTSLVVNGESDYEKSQNELNKVREALQSKEKSFDDLNRQFSILQSEISDTKRNLENESQTCFKKENEITGLRNQLESLQTKISAIEEHNKNVVADLKDRHRTELTDIRKAAEAEIERLKASHALSETSLRESINQLENQNFTAKDQYKSLDAKLQSSALQIRSLKSRAQELENEYSEKQKELEECQKAAKKAQVESLELRSKFETADQRECDAREKLSKLEKVNSSLNLRLHEFSSVDISALKVQATEAMQLRQRAQEHSNQVMEWRLTFNQLTSEIQNLHKANQELQEHLNNMKMSEKQREEETRQSIIQSHQNQLETQKQLFQDQIDSQRQNFEYSYNSMKEVLEEVQKERDLLKSKHLDSHKKLSSAKFELESTLAELADLRSTNQHLNDSCQSMENELKSQKSSLHIMDTNISELRAKLETDQIEIKNLEGQIEHWRSQVYECQEKLSSQISDISNERSSWQKKEKAYDNYVQSLFSIRFADSYQIRSLVFIKMFYGKCFPRLDLKKEISPSEIRRHRTLKEAILVIIAVVRFRMAGYHGLKRHAKESAKLLS